MRPFVRTSWVRPLTRHVRLVPCLQSAASSSTSFPSKTSVQSRKLCPKAFHQIKNMATTTTPSKQQFERTSGATDAVWVHLDEYGTRPEGVKPLSGDVETDVCIVGSGIAGVSIAHELVERGKQVIMLEARELLSGETSRTSGHLSNALDDGYTSIKSKHGKKGAKAAAESHTWALKHVGEIAVKLGIDCEYRQIPGYTISQYSRGDPKHEDDIKSIQEDVDTARGLGIDVTYVEGLAIKGWESGSGQPDQRDGAVWHNQATFHPTKYVNGVLGWLLKQPNFRCHNRTRVVSFEEPGIEILGMGNKHVEVKTQNGNTIKCEHAVEATNVPLQKLSVVVEMACERTYCIAIRVPKGSVEDCLIYDTAEEYKHVRMTERRKGRLLYRRWRRPQSRPGRDERALRGA